MVVKIEVPLVPKKVRKKVIPKVYVTKRLYYGCDQGHYGSFTCGHCGADAENNFFRCSNCNYWFERETDVSHNTGGSDF